MTTTSSLNLPYLAVLVVILLLSGVAEYLKLAPVGTFYTFLLLVIGLVAPSPLAHPTIGPNETVAVSQNAPISLQEGQQTTKKG